MEQQELVRGSVAAIVYQNPENGYAVLRVDAESGEMVTVVGTIPSATVGERLSAAGKWRSHATYGRQFEAELLERLMPESTAEILAYLSSAALKGIGPKTAARIVARFGQHSLEVIENEPEQLVDLPGMTLKKAQEISALFRRQVGVRRLIEFLAGHGLPADLALRLYRGYGDLAVDAVRDDPYLLTDSYFGADFARVDAFAQELGVAGDDERRVEAGILFELSHNLGNGHTFLPTQKLIAATCTLLNLEQETVAAAMNRLDEQERIKLDTLLDMGVCYLPQFYDAEVYVTSRILDMAARMPDQPSNLDKLMRRVEQQREISFAPKQLEAIEMAARHQVLLLTGGPGTGKTTTLSGILGLFDALELETQLAAPTGRAAKRLTQLTGREAATIHRLLEAQYNPEQDAMVFFHDEDEPLKVDAVVVDETSMVDLQLMQSLLRALPERCRLVLVGDPDQLPSVGAGNLFSDLIRSGVVQTVRLTEIFRQAQESLIVMNAHAVNRGQQPDLTVKNKDFFFMKRRSAESVVQTITELCSRRLPQNMGIDPSDIQVLSPTRKYETGTVYLNKHLQAALNPPSSDKREKPCGDFLLREGDRVMQIRNNYDIMWSSIDGPGGGTGVFNGDIGVISEIDFASELLTVRFDDKEAKYGFDMLSELELAYAMTVHKSQGSEYQAVILAVYQGSPFLLSRSVLYTAITRARQLLVLVGDEQVVATMTANDRQQRRYSGLKLRLQGRG